MLFRLSRARNSIEDSFGLNTNKWTILKDRMDFSLKTSITIVQALICLHNFILTQELMLDDEDKIYYPENGRRPNVVIDDDNPNEDDNIEIPQNVFQQRHMLADYFLSEEGALQ